MGKVLVAFFSASGVTKGVAEKLAGASGGSGLGKTGENFKLLASGAIIINGKRFTSGVSDAELKSWVQEVME